jgi:hypothetical protein
MPVSIIPAIEAEIEQFSHSLKVMLLSRIDQFNYSPNVVG